MANHEPDAGSAEAARRELVDTRAPGGPEGRTYTVPFADVWDAATADIQARRGWEIVHADEERGLLTVVCRSRLRRSSDDLSVWVHLDEYGLTRVDARAGSREGRLSPGANRRRVLELLESLDEALGPGARVVGRRPGR
jgi:hypothetical protein